MHFIVWNTGELLFLLRLTFEERNSMGQDSCGSPVMCGLVDHQYFTHTLTNNFSLSDSAITST